MCGESVHLLLVRHVWQFAASCFGAHLGDHKLEVDTAHPAQSIVAGSIQPVQPPLGDGPALAALLAGDPDVDPVPAVAADDGPIQPVLPPLGDDPALAAFLAGDPDVDPLPAVAADGGPIQPVRPFLGDGPALAVPFEGNPDVEPVPVVVADGDPIHPVQTPGDGSVWPLAVFPESDVVPPAAVLFDAPVHQSVVVVGALPIYVWSVVDGDGDLLARPPAVLVGSALPSWDSMSLLPFLPSSWS